MSARRPIWPASGQLVFGLRVAKMQLSLTSVQPYRAGMTSVELRTPFLSHRGECLQLREAYGEGRRRDMCGAGVEEFTGQCVQARAFPTSTPGAGRYR